MKVKTGKKILVSCGALLSAALAVTALSVPNGAKVQQAAAKVIVFETTDALGKGVDIVGAKSAADYKREDLIFDSQKIKELDSGRIERYSSYGGGYASTDIREVASYFGVNLDDSAHAEIPLAQLDKAIDVNLSGDYRYFYGREQRYDTYQSFLFNYIEQSTYADCYTPAFLADLNGLENGNKSYGDFEEFFKKYGTHVIGSVVYGGRFGASYSVLSDNIAFYPAVERAMTTAISDVVDDIDSGKLQDDSFWFDIRPYLTKAINTVSDLSYGNFDYDAVFHAYSYGGDAVGSLSLKMYLNNVQDWLNSLDDDSMIAVSYPQGGLVPVWDLLPSDYANLSSAMEESYNRYYRAAADELIVKYQSKNNLETEEDGTLSNPYLIRSEQDLKVIEAMGMDKHYALANDIELTGTRWNPIGGAKDVKAFTGTLDGRGFAIKNLSEQVDYTTLSKAEGKKIEAGNRLYFGLFGKIGTGAVVKNLTLKDVNISIAGPAVNNKNTRVMIGVLAAVCNGTVQNVSIVNGWCRYGKCTNGVSYVGGIAGLADGATFENCVNRIALTSARYAAAAGGLCGYAKRSSFIDCANYGNLTVRCTAYGAYAAAGGMVGQSCRTFANAFVNCENGGSFKTYTFNKHNVSSEYCAGDLCDMTNGRNLSE